MIEIKRVEIRDRMTMMPAIALRITGGPTDPILYRAGFGDEPACVILIDIVGMRCQYDPYDWGPKVARTLPLAHLWLTHNWERHRDGGVVDVEFIEGERDTPKESEIVT
jgi:hypothetical protein